MIWLFKTEPDTFSIDDLQKKKTEAWNGVRNYQARNFLRDNTKIGDTVLFYHSSCKIPGVAGLAKISSSPYPDTTALDPKSEYYDPKATLENPIWVMVDVDFVEKFNEIITLESLKKVESLKDFTLLKRGNRLSIFPVNETELKIILKLKR